MNGILKPRGLVSADGPRRLVLTAQLKTVGGLDRFQPAGFPEIGHVIYDAPRGEDGVEKVCIMDSSASMANHLESVCMHSAYDPTPVKELELLPFLRCVTDRENAGDNGDHSRQVVVTSLTEGHRMASDYFLRGTRMGEEGPARIPFEEELGDEVGVRWLKPNKAKQPYSSFTGQNGDLLPDAWWSLFRALFRYDPNSLVHGVLFQRWLGSVGRFLSAHHEARGAERWDYSGVKFDSRKKTNSGQPIFATDDETATELRATFILDLALLRSFGRDEFGLGPAEKGALTALALWKVGQLLASPFRYRSGCDLECDDLRYRIDREEEAKLHPNELAEIPVAEYLKKGIDSFDAANGEPVTGVTDVYWPAKELYKTASQSGQDVQDNEQPE